jgi:DNA-binding NarL/FixJ family response regulator
MRDGEGSQRMGERRNRDVQVLIASSSLGLRRRWKEALDGGVAVQEAAEREALERSMARVSPAILLLDVGLVTAGVGAIPSIQRLSPSTKILLLTRTPDEHEAIAALRAGVRGYHKADMDAYLLRKAVRVIQKGEIWVGRNVIPHLLGDLTSLTERRHRAAPRGGDGRLDGLTPREREVAHLIGSGASNKEIASQLGVSVKTVKAHLTTVFRKLGCTDRLRLALSMSEYHRVSASR